MNVISIESTENREDERTGFIKTPTQTLYRAVSIYQNQLTGENTICAVGSEQFAHESDCRRLIKERYPDRILVRYNDILRMAGAQN